MSTLSLLHLDGRWLSFDDDRVRQLNARPKLERAAVTITDFGGAVSQVIALEGSPSHAVALIERRLRADGLIDNESKILIHQTKTVGNGYQALFTAVPLDRWQQMFAWAEGHDDHCLLVPSVALLWRMLRPGRGIVLHSGRQFTFVACLRNRIVHASALAFSEAENDLTMTVSALADRAGRELAGADEALETLTVEWYGSLTRAPQHAANGTEAEAEAAPALRDDETPTQRTAALKPQPPLDQPADTEADVNNAASTDPFTFDGQFDPPETVDATDDPSPEAAPAPAPLPPRIARGRWSDEALMEIFSANSGTTVRLGPHVLVRDAEGVLYRSGVARLAASASALTAVNPPASRLMYLAERVLPWASAASLLLALALGGLGGRWTLAANDAHGRAEALDAQIAQVEAEITALQTRQTMPETYPQLLRFVERAGSLQRSLDPNAALRDLRMAAGDDVRILRLRLDPGLDGNPDGKGGSLRVDGMVNHQPGSDSQGMQVARFVQRLRAVGYVPEAIDPQMGNARSQSPGGSFSYRLRRADATDVGPTPEKAS